jgi:hypothetical protein
MAGRKILNPVVEKRLVWTAMSNHVIAKYLEKWQGGRF